ncbi:MAG: flavin-containing monooxygenase [Nocardioidaceae bacterium]
MNTYSELIEQIENIDTVVIGAGQAGLSVGHHLARQGRPFVILDDQARIGDTWRHHWDSLRLFTPARLNRLPGMRFPGPGSSFPTKDQMADYLEAYAARFDLPVRGGVQVRRLDREGDGFVVVTDSGRIRAANVVVATGTFGRTPQVQDAARELDPAILQLHSSEYLRPGQLRPGAVLVVGAGHSGADIALETAASHDTVLSGPIHGEAPIRIEGRAARVIFPVWYRLATHLLTQRTPLGRKARDRLRGHGAPLLRVRRRDLAGAGVEMTAAKVVGAQDGKPLLADGRVLDVANVVWCTGLRHDFGWINLPVVDADGRPEHSRGVVESCPGLYFSGLAFQYGLTSMTVGGAGRDANYVARQIAKRSPAEGDTGKEQLAAA